MINQNDKNEVIKYLEENLITSVRFPESISTTNMGVETVVNVKDLYDCLEKMPVNTLENTYETEDIEQSSLSKEYSTLRVEYQRALDALDIINRVTKTVKYID